MSNTGLTLTEFSSDDGVVVVRLRDLDGVVSGFGMDQIEGLEGELLSVAEQNSFVVILDFEGKDFIPAATIEGVFVKLHRRLNDRLKMCNLPEMVTEHFEINQLATLFHIYATLEDARAAAEGIDRET